MAKVKVYGDRWETVESLGEGGQAHTFLVTDREGDGETRYVLKRLKNIPTPVAIFTPVLPATMFIPNR